MEKILRNEFELSKRSKCIIGVVLLVILLGSSAIYMTLYSKIREITISEAERNVTNISELNAATISRELKDKHTLLASIAHNLSASREDDIDAIVQKMSVYSLNYGFYNMGVMTPDGRLWTTTGKIVNVSDRSPYKEALSGQSIISESMMPADGGVYPVNLLTVPVYYGPKLKYVLTATCESKDLAKMINISALEGKGYAFCVNRKGDIVIAPKDGVNDENLRLMNYIDEVFFELSDDTKTVPIKYQGETYYTHFEKLDINDWYLMSCAKEANVFSGSRAILKCVLMGMCVLFVQVIASLGFILVLNKKFRRKTQEVVFKDKLLQEYNFEYLRIYYPQIPEEELDHLAFMALDVDRFKEFNFLHGNETGDRLLQYINRTFQEVLPGDTLFRYSADLFAALIQCEDAKEAKEKVERLVQRFSRDMEENTIPSFDVSIGLRLIRGKETFQTVYSDAMIAKNTVKGDHVRKYMIYDTGMRQKRIEYMEMESGFKKALRNREFVVYYQPKFDMRTGAVVGAEALVRWVKANGKIISPGMFIPCFEESRQIIMLDEFMLESVCRQMKAMEEEGLDVKPVSVNLSRVHLKYPGIVEKIAKILYSTEIDPANLEFEITESALYEDNIPLKYIVGELHTMGCKVNMDDYGTGVSGPSSLANIEFDVLKLDKSFVDKINDKKMGSVIRSTINLSSDLGMKIIAEGIEEREQADRLVEWGCYYAQGFYYSKPIPERDYKKMLREAKG